MSERVDEVLESLKQRLTDDELAELSERVSEIEVEPEGSWLLTVYGKQAAVGGEFSEVAIGHREKGGETDVDLTVTFFHGHDDGRPVIQIDGIGPFRVNVNDAPIWDGDPDHKHKLCACAKDET